MRYAIGIDLGGTSIKAGAVDERGRILSTARRPTAPERGFAAMMDDIAALSCEAAEAAGLAKEEAAGIGIGTPGCLDGAGRTVIFANNLFLKNAPMAEEIERRTGLSVRLDNDANCAVLGEQLFGAAKGRDSVILLTLGTGVGGGVIVDGHILPGVHTTSGELGHMVIAMDGEPCTCGRRGCLEAYASATALIRETRRAMERDRQSAMWRIAGTPEGVNGLTAFDAAREGDPSACGVLDRYITALAVGTANLINCFRPSIILFGGGISHSGEELLAPLRAKLPDMCYASDLGVPLPEITCAALGNDAGLIGAACLCL